MCASIIILVNNLNSKTKKMKTKSLYLQQYNWRKIFEDLIGPNPNSDPVASKLISSQLQQSHRCMCFVSLYLRAKVIVALVAV
jgi:hypothetical protein